MDSNSAHDRIGVKVDKIHSYGHAGPALSLFHAIYQRLIKVNDDFLEKPTPVVMDYTIKADYIPFGFDVTFRLIHMHTSQDKGRDGHWS